MALRIPPTTPPATPPITPPGTPPITPPNDGGGSSLRSLTIATSFGILAGAISRLASNFRGVTWITLATRACGGGGGGAGGGGGGGGGGASSTLVKCVTGSDSTKNSGIASKRPRASSCPANASTTVHGRRVLPSETKLCSNIAFSVSLHIGCVKFGSRCIRRARYSFRRSKGVMSK